MRSAIVRKISVAVLVTFVLSSAASMSQAALVVVGLTPDIANSNSVNALGNTAFNGSIGKTVNDPFAYNPNSPTSPLPDMVFTGVAETSPGYHANLGAGVDALLAYDFTNGPLTQQNPNQSFFVDLYGRSNCCQNRDDNIDIQVWSGGVGGTLLGTVFGIAIPDSFPQHVRVDLSPVLTLGASFDAIRLVAHDSDGLTNGNSFTLMEIRAAQQTIPEPATAALALMGLTGLMARRRRLA